MTSLCSLLALFPLSVAAAGCARPIPALPAGPRAPSPASICERDSRSETEYVECVKMLASKLEARDGASAAFDFASAGVSAGAWLVDAGARREADALLTRLALASWAALTPEIDAIPPMLVLRRGGAICSAFQADSLPIHAVMAGQLPAACPIRLELDAHRRRFVEEQLSTAAAVRDRLPGAAALRSCWPYDTLPQCEADKARTALAALRAQIVLHVQAPPECEILVAALKASYSPIAGAAREDHVTLEMTSCSDVTVQEHKDKFDCHYPRSARDGEKIGALGRASPRDLTETGEVTQRALVLTFRGRVRNDRNGQWVPISTSHRAWRSEATSPHCDLVQGDAWPADARPNSALYWAAVQLFATTFEGIVNPMIMPEELFRLAAEPHADPHVREHYHVLAAYRTLSLSPRPAEIDAFFWERWGMGDPLKSPHRAVSPPFGRLLATHFWLERSGQW